MKKKYSYAYEKLMTTIHALAVSPGDIRQRLAQAFQGFFTLHREHFPKELQADWDWVLNELKKFGPIIREVVTDL